MRGPSNQTLAQDVPAEMLGLHFDDLRTFVKLAADLDQRVSPLLQAMEGKEVSDEGEEEHRGLRTRMQWERTQ